MYKEGKDKKILSLTVLIIVLITIFVCDFKGDETKTIKQDVFINKIDETDIGEKESTYENTKDEEETGIEDINEEKSYTINDYSEYNEEIDFDLLKSLIEDGENNGNIVYSPLAIKEALLTLSKLSCNNTHDQIYSLFPKHYFPLSVSSDHNKVSEVGVFFKSDVNNNLINKVNDALGNSNISHSVFVAENLTPKLINNWAKDVSFGKVEKMFEENDDLSDNNMIVSSIAAIDMKWNYQIAGGMIVNPYHEKFFCNAYQFDGIGYQKLLFDDSFNTSGLEFGVAANKYDIINDLGYDYIYDTVLNAYNEWYNEHDDKSHIMEPNDYISTYMKEISSNYGDYDRTTDFKYYNDSDVKVFYKTLKQYDNIELEYIGIMPKKEELSSYVSNVNGKYLDDIYSKLNGIEYHDLKEGYCTKIHGTLPIFDYKNSIPLKNQLKSLGVEDVFDYDKSDFSKITDKKIYINEIRNDTEISFMNEGIEAISYAVCEGLGAGGPGFDYYFDVPVIDVDLTFDKPFIYFIKEKSSNQVFFVGAVYEPHKFDNDSFD